MTSDLTRVSPPLDDPQFWLAPDEELARLRAEDPVHWYEPGQFWALTRHADVNAVSRDPERFCSSRGVLMADRGREIAASDSILYVDPPQHIQYRKLVSRAFTPRRVSELGPWIRKLAVELIDGVDPCSTTNFVDAVAAPLPILVIAELLGVPAADRDEFRRWSDSVTAAAIDLTDEHATAVLELFVYFQAALAERRASPRDDLLSALVAAEVDGESLTEEEQLGFCLSLLVAGNETTRSSIAGGAVALAQHPEERRRLVSDASLLPGAVEEAVRWTTPIVTFARTATVDVTLGERQIAAGDYVLMLYRSANRDEAAFGPDAATFRVDRPTNPHLGFGMGEHFCLGAGLARLETRIVLDELLTRWPDYVLTGDPRPIPSTLFNQLADVPLQLDPDGAP